MKNIYLLICGLLCLGAGGAVAAAPTASAPPQGNRFLLVVETSKRMKPLLPAVQRCVQTLLVEQMSGELQRGDSLGVWTYNDTLHAGDFPMQVWSADTAAAIAQRVAAFLDKQKCAGGARLPTVVTNLAPVIADSERLTILIFSDGFELMAGTPFDAVINRVFTRHREELRRAQVPFLTVLQAVGGKIIHCTVNAASSPIKIPELPKPPVAPAPPKPAPPVIVVVKTNAPLIVNHSKPVTNVAPPITNPVVAPAVLPPATNSVVVVTATPAIAPTPTPAVAVVASPAAAPVVPPAAVASVSNPASVVAVPVTSNVTAHPPEKIAPTNPPTPATAATPSANLGNGWVWLGLAMGVVVSAAVLLGRRGSKPARTSAITESLDRRKR